MGPEPAKPNVVVCAEYTPGKHPLLKGYQAGVSCLKCKQGLQITPYGARMLKMVPGAVTLCHGCAIELTKLRASDHKITDVLFRPGLIEEIAERKRKEQESN